MTHDLEELESQSAEVTPSTNRLLTVSLPTPPRTVPGTPWKPAPPGKVNDVLIGKATGGDVPVPFNDPAQSSTARKDDTDGHDPPYVLLDAREPEEWRKGHLVGACSYPATIRSRSSGPIASRKLMAYVNKPDRFIVVYDEDEREAPLLAQSIAERGVDNCYLLSGGLRAITSKGIQGIYIGALPDGCRRPVKTSTAGLSRSSSASTASAPPARAYTACSSSTRLAARKVGSAGFPGPKSQKVPKSLASNTTQAVKAPVPPPAPVSATAAQLTAANLSRFDLAALRESLNAATPTDSTTSRVTTASTIRKRRT